MTTTIEQLRRRAEAAKRTFEEGRGRLFQADGSRLFSDQAHEEQLATLRAERNAVLDEILEQARAVRQGATTEITNLENRDPQELLTADELDRANARRAFALDTAESLSPADLAARLESVLAGGDKAAIFAHWMAGDRRRARILERGRDAARRTSVNPAAVNQAPTVTELDGILIRMREVLDEGRTAREMEAARERARDASDVEGMAQLVRREQRSIYEPNLAVTGR